MSAEIIDVFDGVLTVKVTGQLTEPEVNAAQSRVAGIIRALGKVRILIRAEEFAGWEKGGKWNDFSFQEQNDPYIEKMAIVGDRRWEDLALAFTASFVRPFPVEYFSSAELAAARAWLAADS